MKPLPGAKKSKFSWAKAKKKTKTKIKALFSIKPKLKFYYWYFCKYCKVDEHRMLFESFHGKGISDSSYAVLQYMMANGLAEEYEIYYASDNLERDQPFVERNNLPVKLVDINTRKYVYILATAKYLLNNSSFPLYFMRREGQTYVQTWHGTPLKTLGKQMRLGMESMVNVQHNFLQANWLTFPNDFTRDVIMRDYNLDQLFTGKVAMVGYPRNTIFLTEGDSDVRSRYDLDGYTTYAYMPTWRGKSNHSVEIGLYADMVTAMLNELDAQLDDTQKVFVNFHSMVAAFITLDTYKHIFPFPNDIGTYDFLTELDVLITDYSSVMFDYALTGKPVVLFTYDEEQYLADRGMYFPLSDLPFVQVKTVTELSDCLRDKTYDIPEQALREFEQKYLSYDSKDNSRNVLDLLLGKVPDGIPVIDYSGNKEKTWTLVDVSPQKSYSHLNGIFLSSSPDDLIVLNRTGFGPGKSAHVYDNYLDYTFIFRTRTTPRTYIEDVTRRFWPPAQRRLDARERQRLLGDLPTAPEIKTSVLAGLAQTSYSPDRDVDITGSYDIVDSLLRVNFAADGYLARKIMLVTVRQIRWERDLTEEEALEGSALIDVERPAYSPLFTRTKSNRVRVCVLLEDPETHETVVGNLMTGKSSENKRDLYGKPIMLDKDRIYDMLPHDERDKTGWPLIDRANGRDLCCVPYQNNDGRLSLVYVYTENVGRSFYKVTAYRVRAPRQKQLVIDMRIEGGTPEVRAVELRNRLVGSETSYPLDIDVTRRHNSLLVKATFDPANKVFDGIYWDLHVLLGEEDGSTYDLMAGTTNWLKNSFYCRNVQCLLETGNILFPYSTLTNNIAFSHRPLHSSDTMSTRVKEAAAAATYLLLRPYWRRKKVWLVYEKFCALAQDNGFAFFKYCMEEGDENKRKNIYYVMDKESSEYEKVLPYKDNVIDFMSYKHMLYALVAKIYVGSDAKSHLYQWRPKASIIRDVISRRRVFFLQHGVTALKRVDYLFGKRGSSPMTYFLTTSHAEQEIVVENFGYNLRHAPVLGFSRWDLLKDTSDKTHPTILMMPTWRQWLEDVGDDVFLESDYYKAYSELIQSEEVAELLERTNATLKFFIHPKFSEQLRHFGSTIDRVELIEMGSRPLNEIIMECSALITDYSSVCWDVLYMDKPVIYYHFDQARYVDEVGSYIDLNTELPGKVCFDLDDLKKALASVMDNDFELDEADREVARQWFDFKDKNNRKRTYEFLLEEGF